MWLRVRRRIRLVTAILTVVSLAAVVAAVRQAVPPAMLPAVPDPVLGAIPHVNAAISVLAIGVILRGWRAIRAGDVRTHRQSMITALGLFLAFLVMYLLRVAIEGPTHFVGPEWLTWGIYYPILAIHVALAIVCLPLLYYVLLLGVTHTPSELADTLHPRIGRVAASLWLVSFALGIVVYLLLYVRP